MGSDDDLDYSVLGLIALELSDVQLGPLDMATTWLSYMPFNMLYTAENVAYRSLVNRRLPPLNQRVGAILIEIGLVHRLKPTYSATSRLVGRKRLSHLPFKIPPSRM